MRSDPYNHITLVRNVLNANIIVDYKAQKILLNILLMNTLYYIY